MGRTHVVLPDDLLAEIDRVVGKRRRSSYIAQVIENDLKLRRRRELAEELAGSLEDEDIPGWETSESAVEWVRGLRR